MPSPAPPPPPAPAKRRVLVIGGKWKHVPKWAGRAFEIDLLEKGMDDNGGGVGPLPELEQADAVVISIDHLSHGWSGQAHALARKWGVPALIASDGWSRAVEAAAKCRADWFVNAIQSSAADASDADVLEIVDNAWREAAEFEREKTVALERRLRKENSRREKVEESLKRLRDGAEKRVLEFITQRAAEVRAREEPVRRMLGELREKLEQTESQVAELRALLKSLEDALNE